MQTADVVPLTSEKGLFVDDSRLKRIEDKLDALTEATTKLVALETHQQHMLARVNRLEIRIDAQDERVRKVMAEEAKSSSGSAMFERVALVFFTAAIAVAGTLAVEFTVK